MSTPKNNPNFAKRRAAAKELRQNDVAGELADDKPKETARVTATVPKEVHKAIKVYATTHDTTIAELMEAWIRREFM